MSNLTITERHYETVTILDLAGTIRMGESVVDLRRALRVIVADGGKNILLNLADVTHIDSSGLGELVAGFVSVRKGGGELKLLHLTARVSELMMITKLLTVFDVYENEEAALNSFQTDSEDSGPDSSEVVTGKLDQASIAL